MAGGATGDDGMTVATKAKRKALLAKGLRLQVPCAGACKVEREADVKGKPVGKGAGRSSPPARRRSP